MWSLFFFFENEKLKCLLNFSIGGMRWLDGLNGKWIDFGNIYYVFPWGYQTRLRYVISIQDNFPLIEKCCSNWYKGMLNQKISRNTERYLPGMKL